jgi:phosphatidylserine decarboxylase
MIGRMLDWNRLRERAYIDALRWAPKGLVSHGIGWAARRHVPKRLRAPLYRRFAERVGADLDEVDRPLDEFPTFDAFFTRALRPGARVIEGLDDDDVAVSPCDGVLSEIGVAEGGRMIQCKGRDYTVRALLADESEARAFSGGPYATIYLAPRNYHRVHAPTGGAVTGYRHVPGAFFPVNPPSVREVSNLFAINERLITYLDGPLGRVAMIMVAATGVGHMTVTYDTVATHAGAGSVRTYVEPRPVRKGDEVGTFHLGSTVVLLFQPGRVTLAGQVRGRPVRLGETLGRRVSGRSGEVAA